MENTIFRVTVISEVLLGGGLILTLIKPRLRIWPPPERRSWQYAYTWMLTIVSMLGTMVLGILDWDSFVFGHWVRFVVGGVLFCLGLAFALWGIRSLGVHATQGLEGQFVTTGAYTYSRNPQYVGDILCFAGYAVVCNSRLAFVTSLLGIAWFILTPFTEEPWLRERFGGPYDEYAARVPRLVFFRNKS